MYSQTAWLKHIKRLLQLRFDFDSTATQLSKLRFNYDSPLIRLDSTTTRNEHVLFFVASRGNVANKKAVGAAYKDVIVYVTVIRIAFTLTDQHWVASFDCRRWYSPFTHFRNIMLSGMNSCLHEHTVMMPTLTSRIEVESQSNRSRIEVESRL